MSYEKDQLDSFITSASVSTALATAISNALVPYVTSNSLSAAISGINLAPYVTSNSISAAVTTQVLTVNGHAAVSATLSAGRVTVAGRPVGAVLLGTQIKTNATGTEFSGSWSDFAILQLRTFVNAAGGFLPTRIFTDGGTTPILAVDLPSSITAGRAVAIDCSIYGGNGAAFKIINIVSYDEVGFRMGTSQTANAGFVNALRISFTHTASIMFSALYGWRTV